MPAGRGGFLGTHYRGAQTAVRALDALIKLVRCSAAVQARLDASIRRQGVTPSQFGLLEALLHLGAQEPCDLGPKLLTSRPNVVLLFLGALEQCLTAQGVKLTPGAGVGAANEAYAQGR